MTDTCNCSKEKTITKKYYSYFYQEALNTAKTKTTNEKEREDSLIAIAAKFECMEFKSESVSPPLCHTQPTQMQTRLN
jgi:hypothetical protein